MPQMTQPHFQGIFNHTDNKYVKLLLSARVGGGWPNEGAVVRRLGRPAYTARTGSPGLLALITMMLMVG